MGDRVAIWIPSRQEQVWVTPDKLQKIPPAGANPQTQPSTEEQLLYDRVPIPFTPVKRLQRDDVLYVTEETRPHPIHGYSQAHKEYKVIDLRGYRRGYEPRLEIKGVYTPIPKDVFRLHDGHLPPYQPTTTGDKLLSEMRRLGIHSASRIEGQKRYVQFKSGAQIGSIVSEESWERERKGIISRGETPPEVEYLPDVTFLVDTDEDPRGRVTKFCCRYGDWCAPPELLEEGRFLDRIAALRQHYKEKHPGMWGKGEQIAQPALEYLPDSPEYLTQTIDASGWREQLEQSFQEAIARVREPLIERIH